jgi:S-adenosylmethionine hydrolase
VTLLTDFGTRDGYVGAMKGVILSRCPNATIADLSHDVEPQDVLGGALALAAGAPWFPAGTIHVAVVDPGVGSARRALLADDGHALYVGPDNGLISLAAPHPRALYVLDRPAWFQEPVSATFHGRDVFASVAGHLAAAVRPSRLATPTEEFHRLALPAPRRTAAGYTGEIVHCDRFGNLVTNITAAEVSALGGGIRVEIAGNVIGRVSRTYADSATGHLVALVGSGGRLEIAVRDGSARERLALERPIGMPVRVTTRTT